MKSKQQFFIYLIFCLLIFLSRLTQLNWILTADEPLFMEQARQFMLGLSEGDWGQTMGIGYPAIPLMWWSAPAIYMISLLPDGSESLTAYAAGRVANGLVCGLLLLLLYQFSRRLWNRDAALIGVVLLALDPFLLGYNRLLHIAAPLALFMTLTGLTYLLWWRENRPRWAMLTGLFLGLSLLTKSTALLLFPMLGLIFLSQTISLHRNNSDLTGTSSASQNSLGLIVFHHFLVLLTSMLTFFLLWPAMWVTPVEALSLTFGKLFTDQAAGVGNLGMFWFGEFVEDPGLLFYLVVFLLKTTPLLWLGLLLSLISWRWTVPSTGHDRSRLSLWLFALTYLVIMTLASKKSVRYLLPAIPALYMLAGLAYSELLCRLSILNRPAWLRRFRQPAWFVGLLVTIQLMVSVPYHPYYLTYYNPVILGWRVAPQTILVGWGEGLESAADHLKQNPPQTVATWYEWLFPTLYQAETQAVVPQENMITADKTVLYINQIQRDIPSPNIIHYFQTRRQPEQIVRLNGIDYSWIYPGPIAGFVDLSLAQFPLNAQFGDEARLLGYDLTSTPTSGQPLIITLHWQVLVTPPTDRFAYVRLIDLSGHVWVSSDSPPVMGLWPSRKWLPDMQIEDAHELLIPSGTPPGTYQLEVGLYDPTSGQPLPVSGYPIGAGGGLLVGQVQLNWQPNTVPPDMPHQTNTRLAPNALLLGYDRPPATATTGDVIPLGLLWQESRTWGSHLIKPFNDYVLLGWRQTGQSGLANISESQLDPLPLPIPDWGSRAILRSQHVLIVPPTLKDGQYDLLVMLHNGSDPAGEAFRLGQVEVTNPPHIFTLPSDVVSPVESVELDEAVMLAGYTLDSTEAETWRLKLYWQTNQPLYTRYKIFVQLLTVDNQVVAQSDRVPTDGTRPTTGWLPQEIITDPHRLILPSELPAGDYSLIAGLYDPRSGQRLVQPNQQDYILIDRVTVP
ncbi:glycosyltransferase family 39 protein [Anaerolineales bacterium HSG25]|nr:glycosyltransferase family 39 protein [Anaerolineales bacterium HSG25]